MDYTAMSFPFSRVSAALDRTTGVNCSAAGQYGQVSEPRNALDAHNRELWDPASMEGLPVGIQIIGRRFDEEFVLGVAQMLQGEINKQQSRSNGASNSETGWEG